MAMFKTCLKLDVFVLFGCYSKVKDKDRGRRIGRKGERELRAGNREKYVHDSMIHLSYKEYTFVQLQLRSTTD